MGRLRSDRSARICFAVLLLLAGAWLFHLARDTTFFRDEWTFLLYRDGRNADTFFQSHDGQQIPGMFLFYLFFFKVFGLADYDIYRLAVLPLTLGSSALVYWIAARRMGWWGAIAPAVLVLLGLSTDDVLWPFVTITFIGVACFGMVAFLAAERRTVSGDVVATVALLAALTLSGYALAWVAGAVVGIVVQGGKWWKRIWVPGIPVVAYLIWSHLYGTTTLDLDMLLSHGPDFLYRIAAEAISAPSGLPQWLSVVILLAGSGWIVFRLVTLGREALIAWQAMAGLLTFWILTAVVRANGDISLAIADRYIYAGGVFIVLALVATSPEAGRARTWFAIGFAACCLLMLPHWIQRLSDEADHLRESAANTRSELGAAELAGRDVIGEGILNTQEYGIAAGLYFDAIGRYESSPANDLEEMRNAPASARQTADALVIRRLGVVKPAEGQSGSRCVRVGPGGTFGIDDLARNPVIVKPASGQPVALFLRRFGDFQQFERPWMKGPFRVSAPVDATPQAPWQVKLGVGDAAALICRS